MATLSNSSHASANHAPHEITPLKRKAGLTFIKREEHSLIANKNWCIPLPLLPSPKTEMASTLIHLISPVGTLMQQWQLDYLIEHFSYTSRDINRMIQTENAKVQNFIISEDVKVRVEEKICRSVLYMVQFPAMMTSAKHVLMEYYKARWMIEYSGTMPIDHVIVPKGMKHSNYPMKFLLWNCRGASRGDFRANFLDLVATHKPNVVGLIETIIFGKSATEQYASLGFDMCYVAGPIGFGGGLWLMWDSSEVEVDVIAMSKRKFMPQSKLLWNDNQVALKLLPYFANV